MGNVGTRAAVGNAVNAESNADEDVGWSSSMAASDLEANAEGCNNGTAAPASANI